MHGVQFMISELRLHDWKGIFHEGIFTRLIHPFTNPWVRLDTLIAQCHLGKGSIWQNHIHGDEDKEHIQ